MRIKIFDSLKLCITTILVFVCINMLGQQKTNIRVAINEAYPLAFMDKDGKSIGFYVDLINEIGKINNWNVEIYLGSVHYVQEKLKNNEVDILFGSAYSDERAEWMDYSSVVLLTSWCQVYSGKEQIATMADIENKRAGVVRSTISAEKYISLTSSLNIQTRIVEFPTYDAILKAIEDNKIDVGIISSIWGDNNAYNYKTKRSNIVFEPYGHYITTLRGKNENTLTLIDIKIREWKTNDHSFYYQRFDHWFSKGFNKNAIPKWLWYSLLIAIGIIIVFLTIMFFLRRAVSKATRDLKESNIKLLEENIRRRETEAALTKSEETYRMITELSPDTIWISDLRGKVNYISPAVFNSRGYTPEEYLLLPPEKQYTPETSKFLQQKIQTELVKVMSGELPKDHSLSFEVQHLRKDGSAVWSEIRVRTMLDEKGTPIGLMGISRDIHERKLTELKLRESEEKFIQFVENINDIFWLEDADANVLFVNKAFERIFNVPVEYVYENPKIVTKFLSPGDAHKFAKGMIDDTKKHTPYQIEYPIRLPDGTSRWIWLKRFPIFDDKGNLYRRAGIASDITEMKKIYFELEKAKIDAQSSDRLKSVFLGNITHELRTPINGILGFSQLLMDSPDIVDEHKMYLDVIINSSQRLVSVINDLLDISKIESGEIHLNPQYFDINEMMSDVYENIKIIIQKENKNNIKLSMRPDLSMHNFFADESRIRQIISNLIENAIKFTPKGEIEVGYRYFKTQGYVEFYVRDTGIGIPEEKIDSIFERFRQGEESLTRSFEGTGLGLSICKGLVEFMGGRIMVESEVNKGSVFYFTVPLIESSLKDSNSDTISFSQYQWSNKKILIVEDDHNSFLYLNNTINRTNAKVYHAKNGKNAIELFKRNMDFDVILMDIRLPDIDGLTVTRELKKIKPSVIIIAQTAFANGGADKKTCIEAGCDDYLVKPISVQQILKAIAKHLK